MQCRNILDSGTQSIRNKMGSGARPGFDDETSGLYTHAYVYILAREWREMRRLEPYFNDKVGF